MTISRRANLLSFAALAGTSALGAFGGLSACQPRKAETQGFLDSAGVGLCVVKEGKVIHTHAQGYASGLDATESAERRSFTLNTPFRVASISKTVVLLTARAMAEAAMLDLDADISPALGVQIRNPNFPDIPITTRHLLSHQSGISDPEIYWTDPGGDIRELISEQMYNSGAPGVWFEYANFNYGLAATVMEIAANERFDELTQDYCLTPLGLDCGFNWAGVSREKRANGATLYRKVDREMTIQTDGPGSLTQPGPVVYGDDQNFDLDAYEPGKNGTLLSPQGGLRASINDLTKLAAYIGTQDELAQIHWTFNGANGDNAGRHFLHFGPGLYVYPPEHSPIPGQKMVGHHGEAYGMYGGMWHLPQINAQIIHAVTATPQPPLSPYPGPPSIAAESRWLLDEAMQALGL